MPKIVVKFRQSCWTARLLDVKQISAVLRWGVSGSKLHHITVKLAILRQWNQGQWREC